MTFPLATERTPAPATPRADSAVGDTLLAQALLAHADLQGLAVAVKSADDGCYLSGNAAFAGLCGSDPTAVPGRTDADWLDATTAALLRAADHTALAQAAALASDHKFDLRGERREFKVLRLGDDALAALERLDQLEQQQKANDALRLELSEQGLRDQASGLNSRAHFDDQMRRELDLSTREHREFALVYMALDPFNDKVGALGVRAQERICEAMGRLLRGNTRAMDASCRMDDRHFAVLLSGVGLATAHSRMEGLRRQCATQIVMLDGEELGFTVAMGVASFPHTAHGHDELIAACSAALAEAKRRGGNTVALASIRFEAS